MPDLFRSPSVTLFRVDNNLTLVQPDGDPCPVAIETPMADLLRHCLAERSLDGHVEYVTRLGMDSGRARTALGTLIDRGLLRPVPPRPVVRAGASARTIDTVGIVTADRPALLARCLDSILEHLAAHGRSARIVVVDDSREPANAAASAALVATRGATSSSTISCADESVRRQWRERARSEGIEAPDIEWLLPSSIAARGPGGARNLLLLETAGDRVLTFDDDTVCRPWQLEGTDGDVVFAGHVDVAEHTAFDDRAAAIEAAGSADVDLFGEHERLLGRPLAHLAHRVGASGTEHICQHLSPVLDGRYPHRRVRLTGTGIAGDAAVWCQYPLLFAIGKTRARLAADPRAFDLALSSREVVRGVRRATVIDEPWWMTCCAGIDATTLVPPFSPLGAGEDGLFAALLRTCDPDAFVAQAPVGIVHDSTRSGGYDVSRMASATDIRLADVVRWSAASWAQSAVEPEPARRMEQLGRYLVALAQLDAGEFGERLRSWAIDARRRLLVAAEMHLASGFMYPPRWVSAVRRYQQAALTSLTSGQAFTPVELQSLSDPKLATDAVQRHLARLGRALQYWPSLWNPGRGK